MQIKKVVAAVMTGVMVLGMGMNVNAQTVLPKEDTQNVTATYATGDPADIVYSVDITWGSLQYTYTVASEGDWDPESHEFKGESNTGSWTYDVSANQVTVTNHSNAPVKAAFSYTAEPGYNVTGAFDNQEETIATAVGTEVDDAPAATGTLSLDGKLDKGVTAANVGTATVTITAVE